MGCALFIAGASARGAFATFFGTLTTRPGASRWSETGCCSREFGLRIVRCNVPLSCAATNRDAPAGVVARITRTLGGAGVGDGAAPAAGAAAPAAGDAKAGAAPAKPGASAAAAKPGAAAKPAAPAKK